MKGGPYIGGFAGVLTTPYSIATFINCVNNGNVSSHGDVGGFIGGIFSEAAATLIDCTNTGTVSTTNYGESDIILTSVSLC